MKGLRKILAQEGFLASQYKQSFTFKEIEEGVYGIGPSNWGISRNPQPPYKFQLLREHMRAGGAWEEYDSADEEEAFINGPLANLYNSYFGTGRGQEKLLQDEPAIRAVLRRLG